MLAAHANGGDDRAEDARPRHPSTARAGGLAGPAAAAAARDRGDGGGAGRHGHAGRLRGRHPAAPPTLTWYINPDSGGQAEIASRCTDDSGGKYVIETSVLPRDSPSQREQLVRRLAAADTRSTS